MLHALCPMPYALCLQVRAALKDFSWMYKQKGFPYLRDRGTADAEVEGLSLWLSFDLDVLSSKPHPDGHALPAHEPYRETGRARVPCPSVPHSLACCAALSAGLRSVLPR